MKVSVYFWENYGETVEKFWRNFGNIAKFFQTFEHLGEFSTNFEKKIERIYKYVHTYINNNSFAECVIVRNGFKQLNWPTRTLRMSCSVFVLLSTEFWQWSRNLENKKKKLILNFMMNFKEKDVPVRGPFYDF